MAKLTMFFGALLIFVSVAFWGAMGRTEMAALHTAGLGVVLVLCGFFADTESVKQRMIWMHIAVTVGFIGFLIPAVGAVIQAVKGTTAVGGPLKFDERVVSALICLLFVGLCVRSFIAARRLRTAA